MGQSSKIAWCDATWNPVVGCSKVSPGCDNCYAEVLTRRWPSRFPRGFAVDLKRHRLGDPQRWRKPRRIFVNSMSDLFHPQVPDEFVRQVWLMMAWTPHHTFQVLTKRPHRMKHKIETLRLPLYHHIWVGTSVEDQRFYDNRVLPLTGIPAPVRFLSIEPLLGPIDLRLDRLPSYRPGTLPYEWVIVGGESGPRARPMDPQWARDIRDSVLKYEIPFFFKQMGSKVGHGSDLLDGQEWKQFPEPVSAIREERRWDGR